MEFLAIIFVGTLIAVPSANRLCGLDLVGAEELITVNEGALAEQCGEAVVVRGAGF
jgi:hypothetical protein